jgi:hypothetical protein
VGDPALSIAFSFPSRPRARFGDVFGGYVHGFRSGDVYFSFGGVTRRLKRGPGEAVAVRADPSVHRLADAILYMNDGYGTAFARSAMLKAGSLPMLAKHRNAFDNSAMEIAQMCRGAAHVRVEARSYEEDGVVRGSDHANILPAFSIGKAAGLLVSDLEGRPLDGVEIEMDKAQDFICASNPDLLSDTVRAIDRNAATLVEVLSQTVAP